MRHVILVAAIGFLGLGCGADDPGETVTRDEAVESKADGFDLCWRLDLPDGCDLCEALGWYGDGICDEFCTNPDPDCEGEEQSCGGFAGLVCDDGAFCDYEELTCGEYDMMGACRPLPTVCTEELDPVCGCDGMTYDNECEANAAGIDVGPSDRCEIEEQSCGGFAGLICDDGEFCDYDDLSCGGYDMMGICRTLPTVCTYEEAPVCGCDGVTYDNECSAHAAGTDVGQDEACEGEEQSCGGFAGLVCNEGEYCDFEDLSCGGYDMMGICRTLPTFCTDEEAPVCGCDGVTYSNECNAHAAGTDVGQDEACEGEEHRCGGLAGLVCDEGEYCDFEDLSCGGFDMMGICRTLPTFCTDEEAPVCGCDGERYDNECEANAAGTDVGEETFCDDEPPPGDCRESGCPDGQVCVPCWGPWVCIPDDAVC